MQATQSGSTATYVQGFLRGYDPKTKTCKFVRYGSENGNGHTVHLYHKGLKGIKNDEVAYDAKEVASENMVPALWRPSAHGSKGLVYGVLDNSYDGHKMTGDQIEYNYLPLGHTRPNLYQLTGTGEASAAENPFPDMTRR